MKKLLALLISATLIVSLCPVCSAVGDNSVKCALEIENLTPFDLDCASAILMDANTGTVLYEKNSDEALPPASVTKIMTLLLTMEAIDSGKLSLDEKLSVSEYAASMGGSQVFLEPGEEMTVDDLLKSVVVSSANDAAVTLAEAVAGSETGFIEMMNEKARALGMANTNFENATGLDDTTVNHVTSARDIALMSRELISHPLILKYSTIWMDTIRNGEFGLSNTNRLIRFYKGATGLKTGSTGKAKFCISATALRDGLHLIAVIMGAPTRDIRNECAKKLLDHGFANYAVYTAEQGTCEPVKVLGGVKAVCNASYPSQSVLISKGEAASISVDVTTEESLSAPVKKGDVCGKVIIRCGDKTVSECDITCDEDVEKIGFFGLFLKILTEFALS